MKNDTASAVLVRDIHPFTASGMGPAPFRFLGVASIPSPTLAEQNPTAYQNALAMLPRDLVNGCGSCGHCGTPIMNIFIVRAADGRRWGVGCDCINKSGDMPLMTAAKLEKLKADRAKRAKAKELKRLAWLAELDAVTGETRQAKMEREAAEKRAAHDAAVAVEQEARRKISEAFSVESEALRDGRGGFCDSIGMDLQAGFLPRGRALAITIEILAKRFGGRAGSKAFEAAAEGFAARFEAAAAL